MTLNIYSHIYYRYYNPEIGKHYHIPQALPNWIHIEIEQKGNTKTIFVCSKIHVNKRVKLNPTYSSEFSDVVILKELSHLISHKFL